MRQLLISLMLFGWMSSSAWAGPCDEMLRLSNQTAATYRNNPDPAQLAASQNYRNGYNACIGSLRQHGYNPAGQRLPGMMMPGTMPVAPSGAYAGAAARSRQVEDGANMDDPNDNRSPMPIGTVATMSQYDSVKKVNCPNGMSPTCISDSWRNVLQYIRRNGCEGCRDVDSLRITFGYKPPDYTVDIISAEQYSRISSGQATYSDIMAENLNAMAKRLMADLDRQMEELDRCLSNPKYQGCSKFQGSYPLP